MRSGAHQRLPPNNLFGLRNLRIPSFKPRHGSISLIPFLFSFTACAARCSYPCSPIVTVVPSVSNVLDSLVYGASNTRSSPPYLLEDADLQLPGTSRFSIQLSRSHCLYRTHHHASELRSHAGRAVEVALDHDNGDVIMETNVVAEVCRAVKDIGREIFRRRG